MSTDYWQNTSGGDWNSAANWSGDTLPTLADAVLIAQSGTYTIEIDSAVASAGSVTITDSGATVIESDGLDLTGYLAISGGTFELNAGGFISGGTIETYESGAFVVNGGTLEALTYDGTLTIGSSADLIMSGIAVDGAFIVSGSGGRVEVYDGFTVNNGAGDGPGIIELGGINEDLTFMGSATLSGVTIYLGNASVQEYPYNTDDFLVADGTLTFGSNVDLIQTGDDSVGLSGASIINSGLMDLGVTQGVFSLDNLSSFVNDGSIIVGSGDSFALDDVRNFTGSGTLDLEPGSYFELLSAGLSLKDATLIASGGLISISDDTLITEVIGSEGSGVFLFTSSNPGEDSVVSGMDGTVEITGDNVQSDEGNLIIDAAITGDGNLEVAGGHVTLASSVASGITLDFVPGFPGTIILDDPSAFEGTIDGFTYSAYAGTGGIILNGVSYSSDGTATLTSGNVLEVTEGGTTYDLRLDPAQNFTGDYFNLSGTSAYTEVSERKSSTSPAPPCYSRGTLILGDQGEIPVESIRIGDRLITKSGEAKPVRWIGRRSYAGHFIRNNPDVLPIRIRAGAIAAGIPKRDLCISPNHAMFLDGVLVPAICLVDGVWITQTKSVEILEYFHLELESHDIILAEGAWSETLVDDHSRNMFHNAAEYRALYPDLPDEPARYCAPRVEDGEALETIRAKLAAAPNPAHTKPTPLRGHLDLVRRDLIEGWAMNESDPETKVRLRLLDNGVTFAEIEASSYREDLTTAAVGDGRHAFSLPVPGGLPPDRPHLIQIVRAADGAELPGSPFIWERCRGYGT